MDVKIKKEIIKKIENTLEDIVQILEENRFYPSVREAGDAPTESAQIDCYDLLIKLIQDLNQYEIYPGALKEQLSLEEVMKQLRSSQESAFGDFFDELKEIDSFDLSTDEHKYVYTRTVYLHHPSGEHIAVDEQLSAGRDREFLSVVGVSTVQKKEIKRYEWV